MSKFTSKEKINAVQKYLNGTEGYRIIALKLGIEPKSLHYWIKQYEYHGEAAFTKLYTSYSTKFKLDVLKYMNDQSTSLKEFAAIFNLPTPSTLFSWQKKLETLDLDALILKKKGRPSIKKEANKQSKQALVGGSTEALQARIKQFEMKNEYLKKVNALVQNRGKSPDKTKYR